MGPAGGGLALQEHFVAVTKIVAESWTLRARAKVGFRVRER